MKVWCRECEDHREYAALIYNKDDRGKNWIDLICLDCNDIAVSFEADPNEVKLRIFNEDNIGISQ